MIRKLLPVALAAALTLAACGDDDSGSGAEGSGGNGADRAFVAAMIPHHESAVQMAQVAQERGTSAFVKRLSGDIIRTQNDEIAVMKREDEGLEIAGVKVGSLDVPEHMTGMKGDPAELRSAKDFDKEFLTMMIPHHEGAVVMARAELDKGGDKELRAVAANVVEAQEREIKEMRKQLAGKDSETKSTGQ